MNHPPTQIAALAQKPPESVFIGANLVSEPCVATSDDVSPLV